MSEYYDHYHRWEPLAEFHFNLDSDGDDYDEDNYLYCLCSRAFIRDGVKFYYVDKEGSESDVEAAKDSASQPGDDHSHVHFSLDTSYKVKCEKDDGASCYCSASHTENYCSTDEHDAQMHGPSHALQPSDSGADLTYQDGHCDYHDKLERMDQDFLTITENENYLSENTWDKFWAINGERLIWSSWIKKYSDYINPTYLDENNELLIDDAKIPKQRSVDQIFSEPEQKEDDSIRDRKYSYDSKVNPYKKSHNLNSTEKHDRNKDGALLAVEGRRRSCSEHERIVSPRTLAGTDSMTNVTKMTMSSYDVSSSHVTSESTPTDDFSVSSSTSDDPSNDQTRIANVEHDNVEEMDTDQYWQFLWKKHFGEQYAIHYANYLEMFNSQDLPAVDIEPSENKDSNKSKKKDIENIDKVLEIEFENSEGNSQELPTVIEVQAVANQVEQMKIDETAPVGKSRKRGRKKTDKYLGSVGVLLQNLLKDEQIKKEQDNTSEQNTEMSDAGDGSGDKRERNTENVVEKANSNVNMQTVGNNFSPYSFDDGDDDPPEETPINLKRSHELDYEETTAEKIKSTFETMGYCVAVNGMPQGSIVFRKRPTRLRPPRYKKFGAPRKTYFDEEGNPVEDQEKDSLEEREMQSDHDCPDFRTQAVKLLNTLTQNLEQKSTEGINETVDDASESMPYDAQNKVETEDDASESMPYDARNKVETVDDARKSMSYDAQNKVETVDDASESMPYDVQNKVETESVDVLIEASAVPLPSDDESSDKETEVKMETLENTVTPNTESSKRRRRQKRQAKWEEEVLASMPADLRDDPKMMKYWKKRHSLFHRFDEGIRLDRESWFSVTPENVARHIACKYTYDTVLDAFCGAGGNTIQFAFVSKKVIAIDIDPVKIEMAKHNASVYGVADRIQFIVGDFFQLAPDLQADMVFLSPPWGGPNYSHNAQYDIETMLLPKPASELMSAARTISPTVYLYLPRNSRPDQILSLAKEVGGSVEVEQSYLDRRFVAITAYFY